jgi:uroporphyrinogen-III synthase
MRILLTRPEADSTSIAKTLAEVGIESIVEPMLVIEMDSQPLDVSRFQAILATSRNGVRSLAEVTETRHILILAVGMATAETATALGFTRVRNARGDADALVSFATSVLEPSDGPVLFVRGRDSTGDVRSQIEKEGFEIEEAVTYAAFAVPSFTPEAVAALGNGDLDAVALFSTRTAEIFEKLIRMAGLSDKLRELEVYCLSDRIARAIEGLDWRRVVVSPRPDVEALFAMLPIPERQ